MLQGNVVPSIKGESASGPRSNALACDEGGLLPRSCTLHAPRLPAAALAAACYTLAAQPAPPHERRTQKLAFTKNLKVIYQAVILTSNVALPGARF